MHTDYGRGTIVGVKGSDKGVVVVSGFDYMVDVSGERYLIGLFEN